MKELIVAKFGGSSVKDASAMERCGKIVTQNHWRKVVVISATYNTTNQLEEMYRLARLDLPEAKLLLGKNRERHFCLAKDVLASFKTDALEAVIDDLKELYKEAEDLLLETNHGPKSERLCRGSMESAQQEIMAQLYSVGERLSSRIFFSYLKHLMPDRSLRHIDARSMIRTDSNFLEARPKWEIITTKAETLLGDIFHKDEVVVTQGFIGMDEMGRTTILGREGSDYTATLLGHALKPASVEIWTDVPGIFSVDPRILPSAHVIHEMDYDDATLMASLGAKVLFDQTMAPVCNLGIPVYVASTLAPESGGTWIKRLSQTSGPVGMALASHPRTLKQLEQRFGHNNPGILLGEKVGVISVIGTLPGNFSLDTFLGGMGITSKVLEQGSRHISFAIPLDRMEEAASALHSRLY
ncbi:MAG: aspartate kinase [Bdellovibrio sp.]|nr:aspartate kinase [Bdellovibrio sp.]